MVNHSSLVINLCMKVGTSQYEVIVFTVSHHKQGQPLYRDAILRPLLGCGLGLVLQNDIWHIIHITSICIEPLRFNDPTHYLIIILVAYSHRVAGVWLWHYSNTYPSDLKADTLPLHPKVYSCLLQCQFWGISSNSLCFSIGAKHKCLSRWCSSLNFKFTYSIIKHRRCLTLTWFKHTTLLIGSQALYHCTSVTSSPTTRCLLLFVYDLATIIKPYGWNHTNTRHNDMIHWF